MLKGIAKAVHGRPTLRSITKPIADKIEELREHSRNCGDKSEELYSQIETLKLEAAALSAESVKAWGNCGQSGGGVGMRKHNRKFCTRWGSVAVESGAAQMSHQIVNNKGFQLAANSLLRRLLGIK